MENQPNPIDQATEKFNSTFFNDETKNQIHWAPMTVFIAVFLAFLMLLTTIGNLVVCRLVWVCRRMRIPSFYFVVSMSLSDFLMGVLVIPMSLAYHMTFQITAKSELAVIFMAAILVLVNGGGRWIFGSFLCNLWLFLNFLLCSASIFNLCVVSSDRYIAVTSPLNYMSRMNERRVKQIIGISWCGALILASFLIYGTNASKNNSENCSIWGLRYEYSIALLVAGYVLPVSFLVFANGKVLFIARTHLNKIHAQEFSLTSLSEGPRVSSGGTQQGPTTRNKQTQRPSKTRIKREIRIFKTFLIVTCAFLFSWTPFVVILLIDSIFDVPLLIRYSSIILLYCNSALNPFIYGFYNSEFRKALSESLGCK